MVVLTNSVRSITMPNYMWSRLLCTSITFGWNPSGPINPQLTGRPNDWKCGYYEACNQTVTSEDARRLAEALSDALEEALQHRGVISRRETRFPSYTRLFLEKLFQTAPRNLLISQIAFLREGNFKLFFIDSSDDIPIAVAQRISEKYQSLNKGDKMETNIKLCSMRLRVYLECIKWFVEIIYLENTDCMYFKQVKYWSIPKEEVERAFQKVGTFLKREIRDIEDDGEGGYLANLVPPTNKKTSNIDQINNELGIICT